MRLLRRSSEENEKSLARFAHFLCEDPQATLGNFSSLTDSEIRLVPPRTLEELDKLEEELIPPKI